MRSLLISLFLPAALAVSGVVALIVWVRIGPGITLELRVPGLDRPLNAPRKAAAQPLIGRLQTFGGVPADLPGAWPRFRGERFDNIAVADVPLARRWPVGGPKKLWTLELGEGYAGAAVRNGRVYVLDYDRPASADALRCFSLADGRELWRYSYPSVVKRNHGMSRTVPAVTDKYVLALGPKCRVCCLDPDTGKEKWLIDLVEQFGATVPQWYAGQCPMIDGDRAVLAPGGDALLVALDCETGKVLWKSPNPHTWTMTHSSIVPMEFAGKKTYVYCGKGGVAGVAADDGSILWQTDAWKISIATVPSPVILPDGKIFLSGGYNAGAMILQLAEQGGKIAVAVAAKIPPKTFGSTQQTPIFYNGYLYGVRDKDRQLVCLDASGKEVWRSGSEHRFGLGPYLIADGLIYVLDDDGVLTLAEAAPQGYRQLAQARVLDGHDAWGPMALVGSRLILRDFTRMTCIDIGEK
ncbi:MAG: PQQ-like beta-propeller repeat protein [Pirellulales bacterium]|nr:PQQ-like beta-propeller repeat protein [Pirellulales bacterium]